MMQPYNSPQLPWNNGEEGKLLTRLLWGGLLLVLLVSALIARVQLPEPDRQALEKLPPQLARVLERQQAEPPPPPPPEPVREPEQKPEPIPEPKPEPVVEPVPIPPTPTPPVQPPTADVAREQARERAQQHFGQDTMAALGRIRQQTPLADLSRSSQNLSNAGQEAVHVGSVVDRDAARRGSGGVDEAQLTQVTVGEQLHERSLTSVELNVEQLADSPQLRTRSQEELRIVFEDNKTAFDRIYRAALRQNPTLAGTVLLALTIDGNGTVSACGIASSELNDEGVHRRILAQCRRLQFEARTQVQIAHVEFPITYIP